MKRSVFLLALLLVGCVQAAPEPHPTTNYPDGVYRGTYYDYSTEQLAVEFEMKDQRFESIRFIGMRYRDGDYLQAGATQAQQAIVAQYQAATDFLLQKGAGALTDLYKKPELIPDVDAVTGATLKTSAVVSAIYDGLSRMPYTWGEQEQFVFASPVCDGSYRGFFYENGVERVSVSFELKDERFDFLQLRSLKDTLGEECKTTSREYQTISRCLGFLADKPLSALAELDGIVARMPYGDAQTAARLRSAIFGGLSRAPFQSRDAAQFFENLSVADGTYRGHYYDKGAEQMSVQFEVENGLLHNISLRGKQDNLMESTQLDRYRRACTLLEGEPVTAVNELYKLSGGSFQAGELTYAIADALARGLYKLSNASLLPVTQTVVGGVHSGSYQSDNLTIAIELRLEQGNVLEASLVALEISDPYSEDMEQAKQLLNSQLATLTDRPLAQINKLYRWEHPLAVPLVSALWDAVDVK